MSFKENLLIKINLDQMKQRVISTLGPAGSGSKIDKKAMKDLLVTAGFRYMSLRGLEMYLTEGTADGDKQTILVLDNELPVYNSTINDVAMRKEPTLKEMISIKNAMRILNDTDVVISRKEKSLETVYQQCLSNLDLTFHADDIKKLEYDGRATVEWNDIDAVLENLSLFGELLKLGVEPKAFRIEKHLIRGMYSRDEKGGELFGPAVVYHLGDGTIKWIKDIVGVADKDGIKRFHDKAQGKCDPDLFGPSVVEYLSGEVMRINNLV
jgi:hypothetical protein